MVMTASMRMQYLNEYTYFIKNSPWYYRFSRYFFRKQLFGKEISQSTTFENEVKRLAEKQEALNCFLQQTNFIVRWLVGLNLLVEKITALKNCAIENLMHSRQKAQKEHELSILINKKIVTTCSEEHIKPIKAHLMRQSDFIKTIPPVSYQLMPFVFWRFGRNNEIVATSKVSGGKPMTYANLIAEKKANKYEIECARTLMIAKRKAARTYRTYHFYPYEPEHIFFIPTYNSSDKDAGKTESDIIDGSLSVLGQVEDQLYELSTRVPQVEIGEDAKPYVKTL